MVANDRPEQHLVRLKNQPTCSLLQLRYGPSGSKAVPGHEQGLVTISQVSADPVGDAFTMNSARVARQAGRLQRSDVEALVAEVADTHPILERPLSRCAHSSHKTIIDDWAGELVCLTRSDRSGRHASFLRGAQVATGLARCGIRLDQ